MRLAAILLAPALVVAHRRGWLERKGVRWAIAILVAALLITLVPWSGVSDFKYLERANFLLAAAVTLWLVAPRLGVRWTLDRRRDLLVLGVAAAVAVTLHLNFFAFHGRHVYVHPHDFGHYYLGAKYFRELGYGRLYPAILHADGGGAAQGVALARDLTTGQLKLAQEFEAEGREAMQRFPPERWEAFRRDVHFFRAAMKDQWPAFLLDHGYNATPAWTAIGGALAQRLPATPGAVLALSLLDALLLIAVFAIIAAWFGARAMLLCLIHYCIVYGAAFGYTGGAFLRFLWLAAAVLSVCCLRRGRHGLAGAALAAATALAVFPVFLFIALGLVIVGRLADGAGIDAGQRRFVLAFAVTLLALTGAATWAVGAPAWTGFRDNITTHLLSPATNRVGLDVLLTQGDRHRTFDEEYRSEQAARRSPAFAWQRGIAVFAVMGLIVACRRRIDDAQALVLGLALLFVAVSLSAYYYSLLIVWTLVFRDRPAWLAGMFALEAATGAVSLFEERVWVVYLHRSLMLGSIYLAAFAAILTRRDAIDAASPAAQAPV